MDYLKAGALTVGAIGLIVLFSWAMIAYPMVVVFIILGAVVIAMVGSIFMLFLAMIKGWQ